MLQSVLSGVNAKQLVVDGSGNIYVVHNPSGFNTVVGKYTTTGQVINPSLISGAGGGTSPQVDTIGLELSGDGYLYVAFGIGQVIGKYTTNGVTVNASLVTAQSMFSAFAVEENGYLYVADGNRIAKYTTAGVVVNPSLITTDALVSDIAVDGNGYLYLAYRDTGKVAKYTTAGAVVNASLISGLTMPLSMVVVPQSAQDSLTNALVAYYPFNGNVRDEVSGRSASVNGSPGFVDGYDQYLNGAVHFDGHTYLDIGSFPLLGQPETAFTVGFWFKFDSTVGGNILGDHILQSQSSYTFEAIVDAEPEPGSQFDDLPFDAGHVVLFPLTKIVANQWFSLTYSFDGSGNAKAYVNGVLMDSGHYDPQQRYGAGTSWWVGKGEYDNIVYYQGSVDELRIYQRALTDAEVRLLYMQASRTPPPSVALVKAVKPSLSNLVVTTNYQLQVSGDMNTWTNHGSTFTATNTSMVYPQYWDVENWNSLFFRLQVAP